MVPAGVIASQTRLSQALFLGPAPPLKARGQEGRHGGGRAYSQ